MGPQEQRTVARTAKLGVVGVAIMVLTVYVAFTAHSGLPFAPRTQVKAAFHDIGAIHPNSDVRQNGIRIGHVAKVDYVNGEAVATLSLDGHRDVYANARASVQDFSALSQKYIELEPGAANAGDLNDRVIPASRDTDTADVYQLLNSFDNKSMTSATKATRELGDGAAGHGPDLQEFLHSSPRLLTDVGTISETLASDPADLHGLLASADELSSRLVGRRDQIAALIDQSGATLDAISTDHGKRLDQTLQRLPATLDSARTAFRSLNRPLADTGAFFRSFRGGAASLARSENDVRTVLREAPKALVKVPGVANQALPAVDDLAGTVKDARPLAPRVAQAFDSLASPVAVLARYSLDIDSLWARLRNMTSENIGGKHYGRTTFNVNGRAISGLTGAAIGNDPYPRPGRANYDRQGSLIYGGAQ